MIGFSSNISFIINILVYLVAVVAFLLLVGGYNLHHKNAAKKKREDAKRRSKRPTSSMVALSHNDRHAGNEWYSQVYSNTARNKQAK